jgi:hypothetical protein
VSDDLEELSGGCRNKGEADCNEINDMETLNLKKLSHMEINEQNKVKISERFAVLNTRIIIWM